MIQPMVMQRSRYFIAATCFLIFTAVVIPDSPLQGQSVDVDFERSSIPVGSSIFGLDNSAIQSEGRQLTIIRSASDVYQLRGVQAFRTSSNRRYAALLSVDGGVKASLIDGRGEVLNDRTMEYVNSSDNTLDLYVFNDGRVVTRDNVSNFTFLDMEGEELYSHSNMSGSADGEVASELAADPSGRTVLLYIPRINYGEQEGSMARRVDGEKELTEIFRSRDRQIRSIDISDNGSFLLIVTTASGTDDRAHLMDRFGNELTTFQSGEELEGGTVSNSANHVTLYSNNRVQVYRTSDQERIGSSTIRQPVIYAAYSEEDEQILLLSGEQNRSGEIQDGGVQAIHLGRRSIARTSLPGGLTFLDRNQIRIQRSEANHFEVLGLNRPFEITTNF